MFNNRFRKRFNYVSAIELRRGESEKSGAGCHALLRSSSSFSPLTKSSEAGSQQLHQSSRKVNHAFHQQRTTESFPTQGYNQEN
jgi:hypothetical protein